MDHPVIPVALADRGREPHDRRERSVNRHQDSDGPSATLLASAVSQLSQASTLSTLIDIAKTTARQLVQADGVSFVLREGPQCHYVDEDAITPLWKGRRFPMSACVSGWSMLYRQQAIVPHVSADPRIPLDVYRPTFVRSLVMTPIGAIEPWAALGAYWARPTTPTPAQALCLQALADSTAVAMENIRIRGQLDGTRPSHSGTTSGDGDMVTICAWTRRVFWQGSWISIERFLQRRFGLYVTHGISEEAVRALATPRDAPRDGAGEPAA